MSVFELRQYTLRPGQRDVLIELFDREFVESQEALGMRVLGQFRDLDRPDRFVWVRGFADLASRPGPLAAFYGGPVWKAHGPAANATMIDSDDVLLLRPGGVEFRLDPAERDVPPSSLVAAAVYPAPAAPPVDDGCAALEKAGARVLARLETEPAENNFPALPVRTGEDVVVWFASFPGETELTEWAAAEHDAHVLRLAPTPRSLLR